MTIYGVVPLSLLAVTGENECKCTVWIVIKNDLNAIFAKVHKDW